MTADTIAAIATPLGEGGIAVVRISGPDAVPVAARVWRGSVAVADIPSRHVHFGHVIRDAPVAPPPSESPQPVTDYHGGGPAPGAGADDNERAAEFNKLSPVSCIDQALLTVFRAPHSYTGEDVVELSCHGGAWVVRRVLEACLSAGARPAGPGEFTQRAFLNGRLDLAQAEAVLDTIRARSDAALCVAVTQLQGKLSARLQPVRARLLSLLAAIEAAIDFPDEIEEPPREDLARGLAGAKEEVDRLLSTADAGRIYREGLRVALAGRPNVGKSSLLNALLREARAIVTDIPGTTRDVLEESLSLRGVPVQMIDTAGLRPTNDPVERIGVERARASIEAADLVLLVLDRSAPLTDEDRAAWAELAGRRLVIVANKADLPPAWDASQAHELLAPGEAVARRAHPSAAGAYPAAGTDAEVAAGLAAPAGAGDAVAWAEPPVIETAATAGQGIEALEAAIVELVLSGQASPGEALVSQARHRASLQAASSALDQALATARSRLPVDLVSVDLKAAADSLALVTGESVTESVIAEIFAQFCVGK